MGPTLVWYLLGARAAVVEAWEAIAASTEPTVGLPWATTGAEAGLGTAAVVATGGGTAAAAAAVVLWPVLEPPSREGEDDLTLGRKLCPARVFTMVGLEKERRWRGLEEESFINDFEMKMREGRGG